ncbi:MAG: alkaline shock response membrane anchor protein AmaP [Actinomycetota bacterium]|nr:alkaline shock response membrane anchor protein AmaP [Actinomycetota bacterium]
MNAAVDRVNRSVLTLISLLLIVGAGLGLARSYGAFGRHASTRQVISPQEYRWVAHNAGWFWPAVAVLSLLLALFGLRWAIAQVRTDRVGELELEPGNTTGSTRLATSAVGRAVSEEIEDYEGVSRASARFAAGSTDPHLQVTVGLDDGADVRAVRQRIEQEAVAHARQAVGEPGLPVRVALRVDAALSETRPLV